jgi:hypothetical protein
MFPYVPEGLEDFVDKVVPELSGEACSDANTRARLCGKISDCRGPRISSSVHRKNPAADLTSSLCVPLSKTAEVPILMADFIFGEDDKVRH